MKAISEEAVELVEHFRSHFQGMGYGDGHYFLACHAAFPIAFTPDMLYQIWANFKQYPAYLSLSGHYEQIDPIAVSDLLLSNLCHPVALDIFEMDNDVRAYLLQEIRQDPRFGEQRVWDMAKFLLQYWKVKTLADYPESFKQAIYWTALATLAPREAAKKISSALSTIKEEQVSEIFRMSNLLEAYSAQEPNFGKMAAYLKGMKAVMLDMAQAGQEEIDKSGALRIEEDPAPGEPFYRMPLLRQMKEKVKIKKAIPIQTDKKPSAGGQFIGEVAFHKERGWVLDKGSLHGISKYALLEIEVDENLSVYPAFETLGSDASVLNIDSENEALLDIVKVYPCKIAFTLKVLVREEEGETELEAAIKETLGEYSGLIRLVNAELEADYLLHARYGLLFITPPYQHYYPLVRPNELGSDRRMAIETTVRQLAHIAKWEFIKRLKNKKEQLSGEGSPPIRVEAFHRAPSQEAWNPYFYTERGSAIEGLEPIGSKESYQSNIKVELTNESDQDLYYSFLLLTINFESSTALMEQPVNLIQAKETVTIPHTKDVVIPIAIDQQILDYNRPEGTIWFKIFFNEKPINSEGLRLQRLPLPLLEGPSKNSGSDFDDEGLALVNFRNWSALLIPITLKNPRYNSITQSRLLQLLRQPLPQELPLEGSLEQALKQFDEQLLRQLDTEPIRRIDNLLGNKSLAPFAAANYLEPYGLSGRLGPRQGISVGEGLTKDFLREINAYGRTIHLIDFERRVKKYPDRLLIIAEGDSWFQHPAIQDVADHLSKRHNVYSRGAAANEMRHFLVTENYLHIIEILEECLAPRRVAFFLLSGGGHDILVEQFRESLNDFDNAEAMGGGQQPKRFILPHFFDELLAIIEVYKQIFRQLQSQFPHIHILVHGYDYFLPKNEGEAGGKWLGQPLTEKGILKPGDRAIILKFMVDEFNVRLAEAARSYNQVTYIDLRGTLKSGEWANELFPNSAGFRAIAGQFEQTIDKIIRGDRYQEPVQPQESYEPEARKAEAPSVEEQLAKAIGDARTAFEQEGAVSDWKLKSLATPLRKLAPEIDGLDVLEELFEEGGNAPLFSAAVLLEIRKDPDYLEQLIANINNEKLEDRVHWRLLRTVSYILTGHTISEKQRQSLIKGLREAAQQRGAEDRLPFKSGTSLYMISQICNKVEPKIGYKKVFSNEQLGKNKRGIDIGPEFDGPDSKLPRGRNYLFVVGIDQYKDVSIPNLNNSVRGAEGITKILVEKYQFEREHLFTLYNNEATQSAIINRLRRLVQTVVEEDTLVMYFAGNGEYDEITDEGYWIPSDGRHGEVTSYISFDQLIRLIRAIRTRHTFIISDSCFSGKIFSTNRGLKSIEDRLETLPSRWMLAAGRGVTSDGPPGEYSPFTQAILKVLKINQESRLRVSQFCENVVLEVGNNSDMNQLPVGNALRNVGDMGGEFMFRLKAFKDTIFENPLEEGALKTDTLQQEPSVTSEKEDVVYLNKVKLFICYAYQDREFVDRLNMHLASLKRKYVDTWEDSEILPGASWNDEIERKLREAHIILLMISPDFLNSDFIYTKELPLALARHKAGEAIVIPIILRPSIWDTEEFAGLQALPKDARPISQWPDEDIAWVDVTRGLLKEIKTIIDTPRVKRQVQPEAKPQVQLEEKSEVNVFISYSHEDRLLVDKLNVHLAALRREYVDRWEDSEILPGASWSDEIENRLREANVILLMISPDFLDSKLISENVLPIAMDRHNNGDAVVIPIILRPSGWEEKDISAIQALPRGAQPITQWADENAALADVVKGLSRVMKTISTTPKVTPQIPLKGKSEVNVFLSYSYKDRSLVDKLKIHLASLRRQYVNRWEDSEILPGASWSDEIENALRESNVILLMISPDFINSDFIYAKELPIALELHKKGDAVVIPIILRPSLWQTEDFPGLQKLPRSGRPVSQWEVEDEAWVDVAVGLHRVINNIRSEKS